MWCSCPCDTSWNEDNTSLRVSGSYCCGWRELFALPPPPGSAAWQEGSWQLSITETRKPATTGTCMNRMLKRGRGQKKGGNTEGEVRCPVSKLTVLISLKQYSPLVLSWQNHGRWNTVCQKITARTQWFGFWIMIFFLAYYIIHNPLHNRIIFLIMFCFPNIT